MPCDPATRKQSVSATDDLLCSCILAPLRPTKTIRISRLRVALFVRCLRRSCCELLEARIIAKRIEHWIELEQRGSGTVEANGASYGIESIFRKAAMAIHIGSFAPRLIAEAKQTETEHCYVCG
jgi:hypothetical protein